MSEKKYRQLLTTAKRVVIKIGTNILVHKNGRPNEKRISHLCHNVASLKAAGHEVILVSSGAIGAGMYELGIKKRPEQLADLQMAASVGQSRLLSYYDSCFKQHGICISQVLLTHDDLRNRQRHLNARNTLLKLLQYGVVPIVNENDVVAVDEIKVGDNDVLSALVTALLGADALILLTTPNGLRKPVGDNKTQRVPYLTAIDDDVLKLVSGKTNALSTGGMETKLQAAETAAKVGAMVVIASGVQTNVIEKVISGKDVGTLISNQYAQEKTPSQRKRWLTYFHRAQGQLIVDSGAAEALISQGKSLLPAGIKLIKGDFSPGSMVNILNESQQVFAQGLVEYSSQEINQIKGKHSREISRILNYCHNNAVVHRNNLVITRK